MNIFVLDKNPRLAAQYHCDKHVVKMILESAQIMSTVLYMKGLPAPYKPTHIHHPCVKWAAASWNNFGWLLELFFYLCIEYELRYNKIHKCDKFYEVFEEALTNVKDFSELEQPSIFVQCMPDEYKQEDVVEAYRTYYNRDKASFAKWKLGNVPFWFNKGENHA